MSEGTVVEIVIAPAEGAPTETRAEVRAVAGSGLEGDRYFVPADAPDSERDPTREVTLIAVEGIEAANEEARLGLEPHDMRRNIVTRGVDLDGLVGREFSVGEVRLEGMKANPPCRYLQDMIGKPLLKPMIERGGLRARIVAGGTIRVGDAIRI